MTANLDDLHAEVGRLVLAADQAIAALGQAETANRTLAAALAEVEAIAQDEMDLGRHDLSHILDICHRGTVRRAAGKPSGLRPGDRVRYVGPITEHDCDATVEAHAQAGPAKVLLRLGNGASFLADVMDVRPLAGPVLACGHTAEPRERFRAGDEKWCPTCQRWENLR